MYKRIIAVLAAILMGVGTTLVAAQPAQAVTWQKQKCWVESGRHYLGNGWDVAVCVSVRYRNQDDGTGVRVEDLWVDVNRGCADLEGSPKIKNNEISVQSATTGASSYHAYLSDFCTCAAYRDIEAPGPDTGNVNFTYFGELNINNGDNRLIASVMKLCVNAGC